MAITNKVNDNFVKTETSIDMIVDDLVIIAQAKLDASWNDVSKESMSKIHAEIMSEVFMELGRRMMKL